MNRLLFGVLGILAGCFAVGVGSGYRAVADIGLVQSNNGAPTAISTSAPVGNIVLQGQGYCSVVIGGSPVGLTAVPQTSGDNGVTWQTASSINGGSITAAGTYAGTIVAASNGLTQFRLNVTGYTSGSTTYILACGPQNVASSGGGGTVAVSPLPLPVSPPTCPAAPNAPCVQVTGLVSVSTAPPYVAPTCPGAPNAPCVQITGIPTVIVSAAPSPVPVPTASPGGWPGQQVAVIGSSTAYYWLTYPDVVPTWTAKQTATASTTVLLKAGVAGQDTFVYWVGAISGGTVITVLAAQIETGSTTTTPCDTGTVTYTPVANNITTALTNTAGATVTMLGGIGGVTGQMGIGYLSEPWVIPGTSPATNVCIVYSATTNTSGEYFGIVAVSHAN